MRRAESRRVLGRRCPRGQGDVVSHGGQAQGRRDSGVLMGRLVVAQGARRRNEKDDGGSARATGRQSDAFRRATPDLRRLRDDRRGVSTAFSLPVSGGGYLPPTPRSLSPPPRAGEGWGGGRYGKIRCRPKQEE